MNNAPLILTLKMDEPSFRRLDELRRAHFPRARNFIPAHLTLFHHLPGHALDAIASSRQSVLHLRATGLTFLGRGVAYAFDAPELARLRTRLAEQWSAWLTEQDRQGFRPHVTIQNKVPAGDARALLQHLEACFTSFHIRGEGLLLWRYLGGPWEPIAEFAFEGSAEPCSGYPDNRGRGGA